MPAALTLFAFARSPTLVMVYETAALNHVHQALISTPLTPISLLTAAPQAVRYSLKDELNAL